MTTIEAEASDQKDAEEKVNPTCTVVKVEKGWAEAGLFVFLETGP